MKKTGRLVVLGVMMFLGLVGFDWEGLGAGSKGPTLDLGQGVRMKLVKIPAGKFMMGSPLGEWCREDDEGLATSPGSPSTYSPQIEVTISKPFYMGMTPVTVDQFAAFVKDTGYKSDAEKVGWSYGFEMTILHGLEHKHVKGCSWRDPSFNQGGNHPVVQVSWNDAQAFCDWLSRKSGKTVVLPTEAQWEYACRAGAKTAFPWGYSSDDGEGWANSADQSLWKMGLGPDVNYSSWDDGFAFTSPVASFKANAFGLYDMVDNVWQWCEDRYGRYQVGPVTDPTGDKAGDLRVLRGGSWLTSPWGLRSAFRLAGRADERDDNEGFRVVVLAAGMD